MNNDFSLKKILQITFPTFLSQATLMTVGMVDMYFAGGLGTAAVSTLFIAHTTWSTIAAFFEGLRLGTTVIASRLFGEKRHEDMYHVGRIGILTSIIIGVLLVVFSAPISKIIYGTIVQDPHVQALGLEYFPWILACGGFVFITFVIDGMFRGVNRVVIPTIITLITQSLNIGLNCVFVWGLFGIKPMGIKGIALATFIAYAVAAVFAVIALYTQGFKDLFKPLTTPFRNVLKDFSKIAAGIGLHSGFRLLAMGLFSKMLGSLGSSALASFGIASNVFHMSYIPGLAFMFTMSMLVSKLIGSAQTDMLWHIAKRVAAAALTCAGILGIFVFFWAHNIAVFFSPTDLLVAENAAILIRIVAVNQFIVMLNFMFRGYLNGAHETTFLMASSLFTTYGIFLPLAYFFAIIMKGGLIGAYCGVVIWNSIDTISNALRTKFIANKFAKMHALQSATENSFKNPSEEN